jgi:hypothetical protein
MHLWTTEAPASSPLEKANGTGRYAAAIAELEA